jgi:hypothetical protein
VYGRKRVGRGVAAKFGAMWQPLSARSTGSFVEMAWTSAFCSGRVYGGKSLGEGFGLSVGARSSCCEGCSRRAKGAGVDDDETGMEQIAGTGTVRVLQLSLVGQ